MLVHTQTDSQNPRIEALRRKHEHLSSELENERKKLSSSDLYITRLKKEKLQIKEEMSGLLHYQDQKSVAS